MTAGAGNTVLGWTLADAVAAAGLGPGGRLRVGGAYAPGEIAAPAGAQLSAAELRAALRAAPGSGCFLSLGNTAAAPELTALAALFEALLAETGVGLLAACLAAPALGRTVYQGHLFAGGRLLANLPQALGSHMAGRVLAIPHDVVLAGASAVRRRLSAAREQGVALALLDCVSAEQGAALAEVLSAELLAAAPAWALPKPPAAETAAPPAGQTAILVGALDRQTLFQLGAARGRLPFLQLDLAAADPAGAALGWAAVQTGPSFLIAASAPPDRLHEAGAVGALCEIATGLASAGIRKFVIAGSDTAAAILERLGVVQLETGAPQAGLRWLHGGNYNFLLKPGGFGDRDLFLDAFGPQIRLNNLLNIPS